MSSGIYLLTNDIDNADNINSVEIIDYYRELINREYKKIIDSYKNNDDKDHLFKGINCFLANHGKFLRPFLALLTEHVFSPRSSLGLQGALAIEMIHNYSLIHDDLPCMDDASIRRGRQTLHRLYDESHALLCGDGLLTDAFLILSSFKKQSHTTNPNSNKQWLSAVNKLKIINKISSVCGTSGIIAGQFDDLFCKKQQTYDLLRSQHSESALVAKYLKIAKLKTGKLLSGSFYVGLVAASESLGCDHTNWYFNQLSQGFDDLGINLGVCYQIVDDLLDQKDDQGFNIAKVLKPRQCIDLHGTFFEKSLVFLEQIRCNFNEKSKLSVKIDIDPLKHYIFQNFSIEAN